MSILDELVSFQQSTKSCVAASATVLVYYWITTLNQEVRFFWRGRWTVPATLFLFNRYTSILFLLSFQIQPLIIMALLLRVLALYPRNLSARISVVAVYIIAALATITLKVLLIGETNVIDTSEMGFVTGCLANSTVPLWPLVIPSIISQTIHFGMLMFKVARAPRSESAAPILANLTQDGSIVFVTSVLGTSTSALTTLFPAELMPVAMSGMHVAIMSIGCSHLLLSVKALIYSELESEEDLYLIRGIPAALALSRIGHGNENGATTFVEVFNVNAGDDEAKAKVVTTRLGVWEDFYFPTDGCPGIEESVFADPQGVAPEGRRAIVYAVRDRSVAEDTIKEEDDIYAEDGSEEAGLDDSWSRQSTAVHGHEDDVSSRQTIIPTVPSLPYLPSKT